MAEETYYTVKQSSLTAVADAIREKGGTSESLSFPNGFVNAVGALSGGGGGIELATITCLHTVNYYTDENMVAQSTGRMIGVRVPIGSIIFAYGPIEPDTEMTNAGITLMGSHTRNCYAYKVTG